MLEPSLKNLCLGSFAWDPSHWKFRLGSYAFVNFRLGAFVWDLRLGTLCGELWLGHFRLGTFDCEPSLGNLRLASVRELSLRSFRLGTLRWELSLGHFRLGTFDCEPSL